MKMRKEYTCPLEMTHDIIVGKMKSDGYPMKSEYFLTERGKKTFEAVSIMQSIGIEIMIEDNRQDFLKENLRVLCFDL